jgi:hypothetical protein
VECGQWRGREQKRGSQGGTWKYCPTGMARRRVEAEPRRLRCQRFKQKTRRRQRHRSVAADSPRSSLNPPVSAGTRLPPQQRPRRSRHGRPALSSAHAHAPTPPPTAHAPTPPPTAQQLGRSRAVRPCHGRRIVLHGSKCGQFRATKRLDSGFVTSSFFIHYVILLRYTRLTTVSSH